MNKSVNTKNELNSTLNIAHYFLFMLIAISLFLCWKMMQGYIDPVVIAIILSALTHPIYEWIKKRCGNRSNLAAFISCLLLNLVIIIPLFLIFSAVIRQGILSVSAINRWIADGNIEKILQIPFISNALALFDEHIEDTLFKSIDFNDLMINISSYVGEIMMSQGKYIISNISSVAGKFFLMSFAFFFIIQDQKRIFDYVLHLSPLSSTHEKMLTDKIKAVAKSAILGTLITALSQGAAGGVAFAICGLPGFFWGAVMAFASLIPFVGTSLIWVPAAIWLFISGSWGYGTFLIIWSALVVGSIDNFVRPLFMKGSAGMGTLLIFFSILGGLNYFGITGLVYGPIIFGLTIVLLYIYDVEFHLFLKHQDKS
ncbi:MAG: AI-2E family transporter [Desulfamplus sp.]|nr:AI-2E family transporter [Desulfamplus sp.]MBF0241442.1 AI-2E family transporter [Desulfamplus sp.]